MDKPDESEKVCVSRQLFNFVLTIVFAVFLLSMVVVESQFSNLRAEVRQTQDAQKKYNQDKAEELRCLFQIQQTVGDLDKQVIEYKKQENR